MDLKNRACPCEWKVFVLLFIGGVPLKTVMPVRTPKGQLCSWAPWPGVPYFLSFPGRAPCLVLWASVWKGRCSFPQGAGAGESTMPGCVTSTGESTFVRLSFHIRNTLAPPPTPLRAIE